MNDPLLDHEDVAGAGLNEALWGAVEGSARPPTLH